MEGMPFWNNSQANLGFFFFLKLTSGFGCLIPIKLTVGGVSVSLGCLISLSQSSRDFIPKQMMDLENQELCCLFPPLLLPVNSSRLVPLLPIVF